MGYNISRHSVLRHRPQLDQLLETKQSVMFKSPRPERLAYRLRQAVAAASQLEEFSKYAELRVLYKFRVEVEQKAVIAEYQAVSEGEIIGQMSSIKRPGRKVLPEAMSLMDVIGAGLKFENEEELHFPNVWLELEERERLFKWTSDTTWSYISHEDAGLTLTKKPVPEEVKWTPQTEK